MQIINPLQHHRAKIDAFAQSLKLWVLELAAWLVMMMNSRAGRIQLQHLLIEARQDIRVLIALQMGLRLRIHAGRRLATGHGQCSVSSGFRVRLRRGRRLRLFTRGIALKSLRGMQRVIADLDGVVTRALARLPRRLARTSVVMVAAMADVLRMLAHAPAPEGVDTS
jgi:hypothetical protein